jgi:PKD repeat protein
MRKQLLLIVFALFTVSGILAQTMTVHLSGTVVRETTQAPVPSHEVIIQADSNVQGFHFYATRHTNANGFYDCTIQNVPATGSTITIVVMTKNCDSTFIVSTFPASTTPDTVNFVLCNGNGGSCQAAFQSTLDSIHENLVHFWDYSTPHDSIANYSWDFGDGMVVNGTANPTHVYAAAGTYHVCLTIETYLNCHSTVCHEIIVGHNTECHALYHFQADSLNVLRVHFWDISTPQNLVTSRLWSFGDPASGNLNTATTQDPWHVFTHAGVFSVCLTISTSTGCTSTKCDSITVGSGSANCENWITYSNTGLTYTFEGHTHSPYPTVYTWDMGDGTPALTGQVVIHTFLDNLSHTIMLHTVDSTGCEWNRTLTISPNVTYDIYGSAYLSNTQTVDHGLAELIRVDGGIATVVDSKEFGDSAGMYWFGGVTPGHYYLRATLLPTSAFYGQYATTYHHDAVNWINATLIELGQPVNPYDIHMHHVSNYAPGTGTITGTISQNGKFSENGTPAPNVEILLMDASSQVLAFTVTNANGEFTFPAIAMGTYKLYPEIIEKTTNPSTVVLDATHLTADVAFAIQGGNISGIQNETRMGTFVVSDIYPNPVTENGSLTIGTIQALEITIGIYSITGQAVRAIPVTLHQGSNRVNIPSADLTKGLYYIRINKPEGGSVVKKFILNR